MTGDTVFAVLASARRIVGLAYLAHKYGMVTVGVGTLGDIDSYLAIGARADDRLPHAYQSKALLRPKPPTVVAAG